MNENLSSQNVSEATAIRLLNSVMTGNESNIQQQLFSSEIMTRQKSVDTIGSSSEFGICRICRWNRSDMQISHTPCNCKGSVGFVHLQCLKRWIMHRRDHRCEICNEPFNIPNNNLSVFRLLRNFFIQCAGSIAKHALFSASLLPLGHVVLQQVLLCMEGINQSPHEHLKISEILVVSCALLTSSALFFQFFEFMTTRMLLIRNTLRQWWSFGNENDFSLIEMDSEILDLFS